MNDCIIIIVIISKKKKWKWKEQATIYIWWRIWLGLAYIIPSDNFPVPNEFFSSFPTHLTIHSKTTKAE